MFFLLKRYCFATSRLYSHALYLIIVQASSPRPACPAPCGVAALVHGSRPESLPCIVLALVLGEQV